MWHVWMLSLYRWESAIMRCAIVLIIAALLSANMAAFAAADEKESPKMLRHVVLFKFKDDASEDQVKAVTDAFAALPKKIDTIKDFEWGTDVSVENKSEGFTHCFVVTFADEKGREIYLPHPAHKDFVKIVGPVLDKVLVVDYWAK
jgi:hypothetical protein